MLTAERQQAGTARRRQDRRRRDVSVALRAANVKDGGNDYVRYGTAKQAPRVPAAPRQRSAMRNGAVVRAPHCRVTGCDQCAGPFRRQLNTRNARPLNTACRLIRNARRTGGHAPSPVPSLAHPCGGPAHSMPTRKNLSNMKHCTARSLDETRLRGRLNCHVTARLGNAE